MNRPVLALFVALLAFAAPARAQLVGTDTAPGESCAGKPVGAARVNANATGQTITLICDGTTWNVAGSGGGALDDLSDAATYYTSSTMYIGQNAGNATATGDENLALGVGALQSATSGYGNTALGYYALKGTTTASNNVGIGRKALNGNTIGQRNVVIGAYALDNSSDAADSVAIGYGALGSITAGIDLNTAIGSYALVNNVSGEENVAVGYKAGESAVSGAPGSNVFIGTKSGLLVSTATNNVFLGWQSGDSITTGSNNILLGYNVDAPTATTGSYLNIGNAITGTLDVSSPFNAAALTVNGDLTVNGGMGVGGNFTLSGDISPAQITANQNNYNPTGLSGAAVLRLNTNASRDITGLAGGADGRAIMIYNVGTNSIVLKNQSGSSTAANRFATGADITLAANQGVTLIYDSTSSRWRAVGAYTGTGGGGAPGGADREIQFNNAGVLGGVPLFSYTAGGLLSFWRDRTDTAGTIVNTSLFMTNVTPTANQTAGSSTRGLSGQAYITNTNTFQMRKIEGVTGYADNRGTGAVENLTGASGYASNTGAATVTSMTGLYGGTQIDTGTVASAIGIVANSILNGGTVTNLYGVLVDPDNAAATVTNRYGVYLTTPSGTATNDWGIYQGGPQRNYFNGPIGIGNNNFSSNQALNIYRSYTASTWNEAIGLYVEVAGDSAAYNGTAGIGLTMNNTVIGAGFNETRAYTANIKAGNDGVEQNNYGLFLDMETHTNDNSTGLFVRSQSAGNSTGGKQYGIHIRLDDADVERYGIYQETNNVNYFAGSIGFDNWAPTYRLQLPNSATIGIGRAQANLWATYSDGRFKTNVAPITNALEKVGRLNGVTYDWLGQDTGVREVGFIAQEVKEVLPEAVSIAPGTATGADGEEVSVDDYHSLDYGRLTPLLVEAIKELKAANDNQAAQIESLHREIEALKVAQ